MRRKIYRIQPVLFVHGAMHTSQPLKKRRNTRAEQTAIEGCILLSALYVRYGGLKVQPHSTFVRSQEKCFIKLRNAHGTSVRTEVLDRGVVV